MTREGFHIYKYIIWSLHKKKNSKEDHHKKVQYEKINLRQYYQHVEKEHEKPLVDYLFTNHSALLLHREKQEFSVDIMLLIIFHVFEGLPQASMNLISKYLFFTFHCHLLRAFL